MPLVPERRALVDGTADVLRDDWTSPTVCEDSRMDEGVFRRTLVRMPAVRSPWLREIVDSFARRW